MASNDLRDKLRKIDELRRRMAAAGARAPRPEVVRETAEPYAADPRTQPFPAPGEAELVADPDGGFLRVTHAVPLETRRGKESFAAALRVLPERIALVARDARLRNFDPRRACFIDTETSALGGGAGTFVFLLGFGFFRDDEFVVEQFLLRTPADEPAMLRHVCARARDFDATVTFFGKNFDRVRIEDKLAFWRIPSSPGIPWERHLDLCHVARRLFGGTMESCRLTSLEHEILGIERHDDLPGEECPQAFFDFARGGPSRIRAVLEHNRGDILSLPPLLARVDREVVEPSGAAQCLRIGRLHLENDDARGRGFLEDSLALAGSRPSAVRVEATLRLAREWRRGGEPGRAAQLLDELVSSEPDDPRPYLELAKDREHRARDAAGALHFAMGALARACGEGALGEAAIRRRLERLEKKAARQDCEKGTSA